MNLRVSHPTIAAAISLSPHDNFIGTITEKMFHFGIRVSSRYAAIDLPIRIMKTVAASAQKSRTVHVTIMKYRISLAKCKSVLSRVLGGNTDLPTTLVLSLPRSK